MKEDSYRAFILKLKNQESWTDAKEKGQVRQENMKDLPRGQEYPWELRGNGQLERMN